MSTISRRLWFVISLSISLLIITITVYAVVVYILNSEHQGLINIQEILKRITLGVYNTSVSEHYESIMNGCVFVSSNEKISYIDASAGAVYVCECLNCTCNPSVKTDSFNPFGQIPSDLTCRIGELINWRFDTYTLTTTLPLTETITVTETCTTTITATTTTTETATETLTETVTYTQTQTEVLTTTIPITIINTETVSTTITSTEQITKSINETITVFERILITEKPLIETITETKTITETESITKTLTETEIVRIHETPMGLLIIIIIFLIGLAIGRLLRRKI